MVTDELRARYQVVIGLEVHAQMLTQSKAYSSDENAFGEPPNTLVSPVSLGHPGSLPVMNKKTVEFAIKLGIACDCSITGFQHFARKNYFYPDLPKGYQITQDKTPICTGGKIIIRDENGEEKSIGLTRIHMEEDAGKSIHDMDVYDTLVDLNRAGVPLLEIVSEPDLTTAQEAYNYLTEVRKLVRYLEICDGNMEEGSLRCDANISVMPVGSNTYGTKVEVKNMNSIRNVQRAIDFEINRQIELIESGSLVAQETRAFDALKGLTVSLRTKEAANDYRYFPEPDLPPITVTQEDIAWVKTQMPPLPRTLFLKYTQTLNLSAYDAYNLTDSKPIALYFEEVLAHTTHVKHAANWVMGEVKSYLNETGTSIESFPIEPARLAGLINLIASDAVSHTSAAQKIFPHMVTEKKEAEEIATALDVIQSNDTSLVSEIIERVLAVHSEEVSRYRAGEKQLLGFLMGQVMRQSGGKIDPKKGNQILREKLEG
jgi:aspartyl-tRNA(Asn)/glutamyl-tRNA(Gln) amidotransferase subunit B